jgi:hypothetical protein
VAKTFSTVPDKSAGDVFTEAMWDTYVKDNGNNLIVPPSCTLYRSTTQSVATGGSWVEVLWDAETHDNDGMHSTSTNTNRITPTTAGLYLFIVQVAFAVNATGSRYLGMGLNGNNENMGSVGPVTPSGSDYCRMTLSCLQAMNGTTDYVSAKVIQTSGGALNILADATGPAVKFQALWAGKPT